MAFDAIVAMKTIVKQARIRAMVPTVISYSTKISSTKIHAAPPGELCQSGHFP